MSVVAWRLAKVRYDLGQTTEMLAALAPVLALSDPFAAYPQGLAAVEPLARRWWDEHGYGHPAVERLWTAYVDAQVARDDPWLAACGRSQLAWSWACEGRRQELWDLLVQVGGLGPREFGRGPTRHPRAEDASTSVFFAQMDVARAALRAAVWSDDEALGREAHEVYADALAEAGEPEDYWFIECITRAGLRFGWREADPARWLAAADALDHPRAELHRALALAEVAQAPRALVERLASADEAGPEWGIDVRLTLAALDGAPRWRQEAEDLVDRFGVRVFVPRLGREA